MLIVFHIKQDENKNKAHQKQKKNWTVFFFQPLDTHNSLKDGHGRKALNYAVSLHRVHIFSFGAVFSKWIRNKNKTEQQKWTGHKENKDAPK